MSSSPAAAVPEPAAEPPVTLEDAQLSLKVRTLDQKTYSITICAAASVPQLKEVVAVETGVTLARQRLIYRGRVLKNDQRLAAYSLEDGHVLHLVVRAVPPADAAGQASAAPALQTDQDALVTPSASYDYTAANVNDINTLDAQIDQLERSSLRLRSRSRSHALPPPPLPRDNDEPDPTMGRSGRSGLPSHVLMGATISVPEGAEVTMPFLNSMIANLVTQVNEGGTGTNERTAVALGTRRTSLSREAVGGSTAAEMHVATARALRRHHRNRDVSGRSRHSRRSLSSAERQFSLRARLGLRLQSVRATLDDESLNFPAELTALSQRDPNAALSEVQQQVEMLLTLVQRFGPRLRLLAAALAQRDRTSGAAVLASEAESPTGFEVEPADALAAYSTAPAVLASNNDLDTSNTTTTTTEPLISSRPVIRTIEVLTTIGESIELLASMARHAFVRQSVQAGELSNHFSASASRGTYENEASISTDINEVQAAGDVLRESARAARSSARSAITSARPRLRFRINTTDSRNDRIRAATTATEVNPIAATGSTLNLPVDLTSTASAATPLTSETATSIHSDVQIRRSNTAPNSATAPLPPTGAHISISGMGFPLVSSVAFPFSLAAGLGGSHATTTWNLADFVSRLTSELPISTLYGVLAGEVSHLHHILAHIGFALFSGVDVPRLTRPSIRTWAQDFENELQRLLHFHALPAGVLNQIIGPEERRVALRDEVLRVVKPFILDLVDLVVRATSASRAAAFGTSSAASLRTMAQQIIRQLRVYARGDAMESDEESDERLKRLLSELFTWFGINEHVARSVIDSLLIWTEDDEITSRRGFLREREEAGNTGIFDSPANKRRRE